MCKCEPVLKYIKHKTNTTHTLTFLKSNYKYKRRFYEKMPTVQAKKKESQQTKLITIDEAEEGAGEQKQLKSQNAKNYLKNYAIKQIIITKQIIYEIKLIFKLFISFIGNLLKQTTCHKNSKPSLSNKKRNNCGELVLALTQNFKALKSFDDDDTSHQRQNYDKVTSKRCQKPTTLHQWRQQQQRRVVGLIASDACNQNTLNNNNCNDSNWQDLSPLVAQLSIKATTMRKQQQQEQQHTSTSSYASNGRINMLTTLVAILFMALAFNAPPLVNAGACWRSIQSNGKCSEIYLRNSTKEECCRYPELFYTDRDVTDVEFFFATTVGDGMTCSPCALSCKSMQCGWNKKCVKRKGRPKCVCAPECGAAKRRRQQQAAQQKIFRGHEPHSEQLRMNRHVVLDSTIGAVGGVSAETMSGTTLLFFGDAKSPRDIRSLSSEITNINLGVEHQKQMQIQNQNQRKMIIMQSQSQQKPQLQKRLNEKQKPPKTGRLLITANVERETEKTPHVQRRLQIFSNVRTNRHRHHKKYGRDRDNDFEDDEDVDDEDDEEEEEDNGDERMQEGVDDSDGDGDVDDWFDALAMSNQRRGSDDAKKTRTTITTTQTRKRLNLTSRHKTNKSLNHNNNKRRRQQQENEMELLGKRLPVHSNNNNNNNFAIIKHLPSQARRHEHTPNHDELLMLGAADIANGGNNNNNNDNTEGGSNKHHERHRHHQQHQHQQQQRKRKHHQQQKQKQQQQQQQQQIAQQHQYREHHKKHRKLKDHNDNNNNNNNMRTRISSTAAATSSRSTLTTITTTPATTIDDWQAATTTTEAATTPVNSVVMSPSDVDRLLNHGSHFAKSSSLPSFLSSSSTTSTASRQKLSSSMTESFLGEGAVAADVSKSALNSDDSALLDSIYDNFNVYGFPNRQFEVAVENFHGPHPVCGSDGRTYNTECQLKKRACRTNNPSLAIAYRGHCRTSCAGVKCLNDQTCVEDQYSIPHCIACKINCPDDDVAAMAGRPIDSTRAVCGVDGKTYRSICDINRMICRSGRSIAIAYPGPCRVDRPTCSEINCGHKHTCLVDLLTHEPRCVSCSYKCARKRRPTSLRFEEGKICGVNNRTYNSWCELRRDSCNTGFLIDIKMPGECH